MWQAIETLLRKLDRWRHQDAIQSSLALHRRGEGRPDGLSLVRARNRLEVRWRARNIHPWDAAAPPEKRARLFYDQLLADTEATIFRLFKALPQVDLIDVGVLEPQSDTELLTGRVPRAALAKVGRLLSVRMRLMQLGVQFGPQEAAPDAAEPAAADDTDGIAQQCHHR
jgi:hypothetical protein